MSGVDFLRVINKAKRLVDEISLTARNCAFNIPKFNYFLPLDTFDFYFIRLVIPATLPCEGDNFSNGHVAL